MTDWGWKPAKTVGIWRHGAEWLRPFIAAVPFLTVLLLLVMFHLISGKLTSASGLLFELPDESFSDGEQTGLVALVVPMQKKTMLFFEDLRFTLDDPSSLRNFGDQLAERLAHVEGKTLLVLADRRVSGGTLMELAAVARRNGVKRILFAEKRQEVRE